MHSKFQDLEGEMQQGTVLPPDKIVSTAAEGPLAKLAQLHTAAPQHDTSIQLFQELPEGINQAALFQLAYSEYEHFVAAHFR